MGQASRMPVPWSSRFDRLLAAGVVGLAVVIAVLRGPSDPVREALLLALAVSPWVVLAVRPLPLRPWIRGLPTLAGVGALLTDQLDHEPSPLLLLILVVCVGFDAEVRESLAVNLAVCALLLTSATASGLLEDAFIWCVGITLGWAFGHSSRRQAEALSRLEAAQDSLAEQAAAEERRRVAREVHDVIAHTLAVTMLHLTGARLALAEGDSEEALRGLQDAERLGRDSLAGLRRSVGLLTSSESATGPPAPAAVDIVALVAQYRAAGADVALTTWGNLEDLPGEAGLAVFRVAQESLANAVRHAPGSRVRVELDVRGPLRLVVADVGGRTGSAPEPGSGVGVPGMRERAALLGGTLQAGPDGSGWRVEMVAPLGSAVPVS